MPDPIDDRLREEDLFEDALNAWDAAALATMALRFRSAAARWRSEAEEKGRTIETLTAALGVTSGLRRDRDRDRLNANQQQEDSRHEN